MVTALRCFGILGLLLWTLAVLYLVAVILAGFANFAAPSSYVTALVVIVGFVVNALLLRRTRTDINNASIGLAILSVLLTGAVIALFAYVAFDPGQL